MLVQNGNLDAAAFFPPFYPLIIELGLELNSLPSPVPTCMSGLGDIEIYTPNVSFEVSDSVGASLLLPCIYVLMRH